MTGRATLYLHAIRNQVGRVFGAPATVAYTPAQRWTAKVIWDAAKAKGYDDECCAAFLGNIDGETSFLLKARGDHGEAGGACQWHAARRNAILEYTAIDVWSAEAAQQFAGLYAEITAPWSAYRRVDGLLRAASGLEAKITVLVTKLEQSGSQARDIARRTPMAAYWLKQFGPPKPTLAELGFRFGPRNDV